MLENLLKEIRVGGDLDTGRLAGRLDTSAEMVAAMLDHLQRLGLIKSFDACSSGCKGCSLREGCSTNSPIHLWQICSAE